jgi:hypothetical protein
MARKTPPITAPDRGGLIGSDQSIRSVDDLTDWVIKENFRPDVVGRALLLAAQGPNAVDRSIALAAVVAKAVEARRRKASR